MKKINSIKVRIFYEKNRGYLSIMVLFEQIAAAGIFLSGNNDFAMSGGTRDFLFGACELLLCF
jgi:hypothetical protein